VIQEFRHGFAVSKEFERFAKRFWGCAWGSALRPSRVTSLMVVARDGELGRVCKCCRCYNGG
jgi:hypothetical protein